MVVLKQAALATSLTLGLALTGCANFFVDPSAGNGITPVSGGSSPVNTGDYVYVANNGNTLSGFSIGTSTLTSLFTPFALPSPLASVSSVAVSRDNSLLFAGGTGGLVCYAISSSGDLTAVANGAVVEEANFVSLKTSPDGKWLLGLDSVNNVVYVFSIDYTTQVATYQSQYLVQVNSLTVSAATAAARDLAISPDGTEVAVAVGTAGDAVYTFNTSTGVLASTYSVKAPGSPYSDDSVAFDGTFSAKAGTATVSSHLFVGRGLIAAGQSVIVQYGVSDGVLSGNGVTTTSGQNPYQLLVNPGGTYLYSANRADGTAGTATVSGYAIASTGTLTTLANSPFASGSLATALAEDNGQTHLLAAAAGGSSDLTLYTFSTVSGDGGQLVQSATIGNGTSVAGSVALATTH